MVGVTRLYIPELKPYILPEGFKIISDLDVSVNSDYVLTFEEFLLPGETYVDVEDLIRRAISTGALASLQHALWMKENEKFIPEEHRMKRLVCAGTIAEGINKVRFMPILIFRDEHWDIKWRLLRKGFASKDLLVRAIKIN